MITTTLPMIDMGIEPLRTLGDPFDRSNRPVTAIVFRPQLGEEYFESPLTVASFFTGCSDYDTPSDELYCPCGATLPWDDRNLGTAVEIAQEHIAEAHPEATAKARAKRRREATERATRCDVYPSLACTPKREQCQAHCIRYGASS